MTPDILFSAEQIQERVRAMARLIASAPLVPDIAMPVLVGGFVFAADLLRALAWEGVAMDVEMIWLRSYGDKRVASAISMIAGPSEQIAGRHVLVIDGVLDAGRTIAKAVSLIQAAGAASVQVAVMLDKQRGDAVARADYVGFPVGNDFVIGYGMDDAGRFRGLPYIGKVPRLKLPLLSRRQFFSSVHHHRVWGCPYDKAIGVQGNLRIVSQTVNHSDDGYLALWRDVEVATDRLQHQCHDRASFIVNHQAIHRFTARRL